MRILAIATLVLFEASVTTAQSGPTYRQLAVEHKGRISTTVMGCGWAGPPLSGIVRQADLAVEGIVLSGRTHPTADDRDIYTEYEIAIRQVILQRVTQSASMPGPPPPTIFKTRGGTVMFDGYPFSLTVDDGKARLDVGAHVVLFGKRDAVDGRWTFTSREVFHVSNDHVLNTLPSFPEYPEGLQPRMPIEVFVQKVRELAR